MVVDVESEASEDEATSSTAEARDDVVVVVGPGSAGITGGAAIGTGAARGVAPTSGAAIGNGSDVFVAAATSPAAPSIPTSPAPTAATFREERERVAPAPSSTDVAARVRAREAARAAETAAGTAMGPVWDSSASGWESEGWASLGSRTAGTDPEGAESPASAVIAGTGPDAGGPSQGGEHPRRLRGARPPLRVVVEQAAQHGREVTRATGGLDVPGGDPGEHLEGVAPLAGGRGALERGVERRAEGEDVGGRGGDAATGQLGRHVVGRAGDQLVGGARVGVDHGDAEVGDRHDVVVADHDVGGLHVTVDDPAGVHRAQAVGDLRADRGDPGRRQETLAVEEVGQRRRGHVLHDQADLAVQLGHVEDGGQPGVVQPCGHAPLAVRPVADLAGAGLVERVAPVEPLDRDVAIQQLVVGPPHGS